MISRVTSRPGWATSRRAWRRRSRACCRRRTWRPARLHEAMRYAVLERRQARAAAARLRRRRSCRGAAPSALEIAAARGRADPRLLAGARRPAVHGRRRPAPRQADGARRVRRGDGAAGRRRAAVARVPAAAPSSASPTMPRAQLEMVQLLAVAAGSRGMAGGQADRPRVDRQGADAARARIHAHPQDRRADPRRGAARRGRAASRSPSASRQRSTATPRRSASRSRWSTTCSTSTASTATLGKTAGKDARQGKPTYVSVLGLARARALADELRDEAHAALEPPRRARRAPRGSSPTSSCCENSSHERDHRRADRTMPTIRRCTSC